MIVSDNPYHSFTVIVGGTEFSGTSLVAGTLRLLGIPMGYQFRPADTHQDVDFQVPTFNERVVDAISRRNQAYPVWGLKSVGLRDWLRPAYSYLRNPVFIFCHRSMVTAISSDSKYASDRYVNWQRYCQEHIFLSSLLLQKQPPLMVAEFGTEPRKLVNSLAQFLRLDPSPSQLERCLEFNNPSVGYQSQPLGRRNFVGER